MDEMNIGGMIDMQDRLVKKLGSPAITGEERKQTLAELNAITEAISKYMEAANNDELAYIEREKIDANIRMSEIEAKTKNDQSKRDLWGTVFDAGSRVVSSVVSVGGVMYAIWKVVDAEDDDRLVLSKAFTFISKLFFH